MAGILFTKLDVLLKPAKATRMNIFEAATKNIQKIKKLILSASTRLTYWNTDKKI
jgi:hypothetical protein